MKTYDETIRELTQKQPNTQYVDMPEVSANDIIERATAHCNHALYTKDQLDYITDNAQFIADDVNMLGECCTEKVPITSLMDKVMGLFNEHYVNQEFEVTITETLSRTVKISAKSAEEAQYLAEDRWNTSEYVLDAEDFKEVAYDVKEPERMRSQARAKEDKTNTEKRSSLRGKMKSISQSMQKEAEKVPEVQHER